MQLGCEHALAEDSTLLQQVATSNTIRSHISAVVMMCVQKHRSLLAQESRRKAKELKEKSKGACLCTTLHPRVTGSNGNCHEIRVGKTQQALDLL